MPNRASVLTDMFWCREEVVTWMNIYMCSLLSLGSNPIPSLLSIPHVQFFYLTTPPSYLARLPFIYAGPRKVLQQVIDILTMLLFRIPHPPEFILVQVSQSADDIHCPTARS